MVECSDKWGLCYLSETVLLSNIILIAKDVSQTYANVDDMISDYGYNPKTDLEEGLKKFLNWYIKQYKHLN